MAPIQARSAQMSDRSARASVRHATIHVPGWTPRRRPRPHPGGNPGPTDALAGARILADRPREPRSVDRPVRAPEPAELLR